MGSTKLSRWVWENLTDHYRLGIVWLVAALLNGAWVLRCLPQHVCIRHMPWAPDNFGSPFINPF